MKIAARTSAIPRIIWNTSPCFRQLYNYGYIYDAYSYDLMVMNDRLKLNNIGGTFSTFTEYFKGVYRSVPVPDVWYNATALQAAESYIKFFSLFFNEESVANELTKTIKSNYLCSSVAAKNAIKHSNTTKLNVLWCDYGGKHAVHDTSSHPDDPNHHSTDILYVENIWQCKTCPGVECSLVHDAGGIMLDYAAIGASTILINNTQFLESTEFMELAIYADVWLTYGDPDVDFNVTLHKLLKEDEGSVDMRWLPLQHCPAVQHKHVYDFNRNGLYDFKQDM